MVLRAITPGLIELTEWNERQRQKKEKHASDGIEPSEAGLQRVPPISIMLTGGERVSKRRPYGTV